MPLYDYACGACGPFSEDAPMAAFDRPMPCPDCGVPAPRALLHAPAFSGMDTGRRAAFATNERSANAPRRSHPSGCGCCRAPAKRTAEAVTPKRPWMLGH